MVRDRGAAQDGWFWGWFGWTGWAPDWPATKGNGYPNMGFGQYCTNCHGSAADNQTFASLRNIKGEPGQPLVYLIQNFWQNTAFPRASEENHHQKVGDTSDDPAYEGQKPLPAPNPSFVPMLKTAPPSVVNLPSQTYDNVWVAAHGPKPASQFVTSDQCLGCHDAGGTGLQFDMTEPTAGGKLLNHSPYGSWRTSPMGLGGRDPIFYAQLASETQTFHPDMSATVQDVCLGCHGVLGQRQFHVDRIGPSSNACTPFLRETANAVPWPDNNPSAPLAKYGALARDGISCTACHHMVLGKADTEKFKDQPQNRCVAERQAFLNPGEAGFAKTFTGSFLVGEPDKLNGPFKDPKPKPMQNALGITPQLYENVKTSELCGTCHTVHLPILRSGQVIGHVYEQTTYPEWAFGDYRTGTSPDGPLPFGPGPLAESCQGCHMPSRDASGKPFRSKIAGIQEYSTFPEAEYNLGPADIDLPVRDGFAKHTLVGLNLFLIKMAQQFPDVLGIRTQDPMLTSTGLDPLLYTEQAMLDQAVNTTAAITVANLRNDGRTLDATVTITNKSGHKFPSGVGFRRAFVQFSVLDDRGRVLWSSGRTDAAGIITDDRGTPITGELWWKDDCSGRVPAPRPHQPHYQLITRQDQAQIYQELVAAPPPTGPAQCGRGAAPQGDLTTSFLSICTDVKDNRLLPRGFLPLDQRKAIAQALGANYDLAEEVGPFATGDDPDYRTGGADALNYRVDLAGLAAKPASVQATLYYQATPPFFLQDRFCTAKGADTDRLAWIASRLNLSGTPAEDWKLKLVTTGPVRLP
jgi:mono/diheme cytochrome c family protein